MNQQQAKDLLEATEKAGTLCKVVKVNGKREVINLLTNEKIK